MYLKKIGLIGLILTSSLCAKTTDFDNKIIQTEQHMIAENPNFVLKRISIANKKVIDSRWTQYRFDLKLQRKGSKEIISTNMLIFTDGEYQTNTLMNIKTGQRLDAIANNAYNKARRAKERAKRNVFEKSFKLNPKYYNKEHLIQGNMDAKNKIVIVSDPLCIACIHSVPRILDEVKNKKDYAVFYYQFPLAGLHPTSPTIAKAIEYLKQKGGKNIEQRVLMANFDNKYDVYKTRDNHVALEVFNQTFNTKIKLSDLKDINISEDMKIGKDIRLNGTPTILFNGSLFQAREKLQKSLKENK